MSNYPEGAFAEIQRLERKQDKFEQEFELMFGCYKSDLKDAAAIGANFLDYDAQLRITEQIEYSQWNYLVGLSCGDTSDEGIGRAFRSLIDAQISLIAKQEAEEAAGQ